MVIDLKPVSVYFYVFIWWSYILVIDGLVFRIKNSSFLTRLRWRIFPVILCSACFWTFFEILNLRIANWHYVGLAFSHPFWEISFGVLAFGTVLPLVLETYEILEATRLWRNLKFPQWKWWGEPGYLWIIIGMVMLALPVFLPKYFFWTIWLAFIFILDPLVGCYAFLGEKKGKDLFSELKEGKARIFCLLLLTGLICGVLWEFWNYWADLKWVYTVPFVGQWKIFEMPILGYSGFSFLAIECYLFYQWLCCLMPNLNLK